MTFIKFSINVHFLMTTTTTTKLLFQVKDVLGKRNTTCLMNRKQHKFVQMYVCMCECFYISVCVNVFFLFFPYLMFFVVKIGEIIANNIFFEVVKINNEMKQQRTKPINDIEMSYAKSFLIASIIFCLAGI